MSLACLRSANADDVAFQFAPVDSAEEIQTEAIPVLYQPASGQPAATANTSRQFSAAGAAANTPTRRRSRSRRLSRAPEMFGDFLFASDLFIPEEVSATLVAQFPVGNLGTKTADNNSPLPRDRVFYRLNYFHNAVNTHLEGSTFGGTGPFGGVGDDFEILHSRPLSVHTLGFEKTLLEGLMSFEFRSAFANRVEILDIGVGPSGAADTYLAAGGEGNLFLTTKVLLSEDRSSAWSAGLGLQIPTGRDAFIAFGDEGLEVEIHNQAVLLQPYLACLIAPNDNWFQQVFFELVIPVSDNKITFSGLGEPDNSETFGPPTLLNLDYSVGRWLHRDPRGFVKALALLMELHSATTLEKFDTVFDERDEGVFAREFESFGKSGATGTRFGILNLTFGVHTELPGNNHVRLGAAFPLADRDFEGEFLFQWNRRL